MEIDGATHSTEEKLARDAREAFLSDEGYRVLRFRNGEVYEALDAVCEAILLEAERRFEGPLILALSPLSGEKGQGSSPADGRKN